MNGMVEGGWLSVYDFGAAGDGMTDDTAALQAAIDAGAEQGRAVYFPAGRFRTGELFLRPGSCLRAEPQWGFRYETTGNSLLIQRDEKQACILNLSHANGATLDGLSLTGENQPGECCGILSNRPDFGDCEDAYRIERCRVARFSGHAVHLDRAWCFTIRHNMFCFSGGDGLRLHGWDGFVLDNWFSGNRGAGFGSAGDNCSVTMTGNRIEWNQECGIRILGGSHYNITGNYIDRSGGPGILLASCMVRDDDSGRMEPRIPNTCTITGNIIYRSGKFARTPEESCQLRMEHAAGVTVTGNTLCLGRDDKGKGLLSPDVGMLLGSLRDCVIMGNTMFMGARKELIRDCGGHASGVIIQDNVGSLYPEEAAASPSPGLPTNLILDFDQELKTWFA